VPGTLIDVEEEKDEEEEESLQQISTGSRTKISTD
jgi:hypothetical protein